MEDMPQYNVSYKPQKIAPKFDGSVRSLLHKKIQNAYMHPQFVTDVMKPLNMDVLMDLDVQNLSGGELQRVAIALCLGQPADIYLIDEPSAYLDSEQRIIAAKVRRWMRPTSGQQPALHSRNALPDNAAQTGHHPARQHHPRSTSYARYL